MRIERRKSIVSQVNSILSERIMSEQYASGSRLPSESELASELGVSRATVRSALGRLAGDGLVIRKQGDGTYVNAHIDDIPTRLGGFWDFLRLISNSGYQASIQVLDQSVRPASAREAEALRLAAGEEVLSLEREFCADGNPVILARSAVPLTLLREPAEQCNAELPLGDFVPNYLTREISYTIFDIEATMPDEKVSTILDIDRTTPVLRLAQVFFDKTGQPVFHSLGHFQDRLIPLRLVQAWE
ncbi:MAG: GntR family transcriptional regulator [Chloroflexota bacterium]|nr:GntR family transcriptional regulator [Chloroflexota bacterium]